MGLGIDDLLKDKREAILAIADKHGATNVRVFGSVARGEAGPDSDIDFLIDKGSHRTPWFPVGLIQDWEELLQRKVDVVFSNSIHPLIRDRILSEAKSL